MQPAAREAWEMNHGSQAGETLLNRPRDSLNQQGTLDFLLRSHSSVCLALRGRAQKTAS